MFLSNKPGVLPGINLLQKPSQKLSRPSGNLANPVIFSRKPGEDKDSTGSVTEGCMKITNADNNANAITGEQCNCRKKDQCPLDNKCLSSSVIYNAQVTTNNTTKNYIGLTEGTFKQRFSQHKSTFKHRKHINSTELSKYIWQLHDKKQDFNIKWSIISRARPYNNISKRCDLCLTEKLMIIKHSNDNLLNKRSELISKCRHENKFYLKSA